MPTITPDPLHGITKVDVPIGNVEKQDAGDPSLDHLKNTYDPDFTAAPANGNDPLPAKTAMSGETQLVFGLPPHLREIPCRNQRRSSIGTSGCP